MKRLLLIPYAFVLMNWAAMKALYCFLRHRRLSTLWVDDGGSARRAPARELPSGSGG
jgi:hypothetical protein